MAEAWHRLFSVAIIRDDVAAIDVLVGMLEALRKDTSAAFHRADEHISDGEQPGGDPYLRLPRHAVGGKARDDRRRRPAVLHQGDETGIEHTDLTVDRHAAGYKEIGHRGEAELAHQIVDQILAAHSDALGIGGGDVGFELGHSVSRCAVLPARWLKSTSLVLYSLRGRWPYGTRSTCVVTISLARIACS